ncbi:MAG TPA: glucose-1-phosphate cytidylyltransferase [Methylomirabilota bacterium]|nr:glucose-1-phosphate cytidylyltransferase [Methylomirabilota bacterium]
MKVVILAGGLGTRLSEETELRPKPMVDIGERPILWHIMKSYATQGFKEFFVALGYKGEVIKRYFLDYHGMSKSVTIDVATGRASFHESEVDDWKVHLMDTGLKTSTGGRVKRLQPWLEDGTFMLTYGDGVSDVDMNQLLAFHRKHGKIATLTAVRPPARFGALNFDGDMVTEFMEKPQIGEGWINGGFMCLEPRIFSYMKDDDDSLEAEVLTRLAKDRELVAYRHDRFWQSMDTLRDVRLLESLWQSGRAPWRNWE